MKIYYPETRLSKLAARPGGLFADVAVKQAEDAVETLRAEAETVLAQEIDAIAAALEGYDRSGGLDPDGMAGLLRHAERIVTLAGTFGHRDLDVVSRSLCDTIAALCGRPAAAPLRVHLQAMRLLAPGAAPLEDEARETVLAELARLTAHLGVAPMPDAPEHAPASSD